MDVRQFSGYGYRARQYNVDAYMQNNKFSGKYFDADAAVAYQEKIK